MKRTILILLLLAALVAPFFMFKGYRCPLLNKPEKEFCPLDLKSSYGNILNYLKYRKDNFALEEAEKVLAVEPDNLCAQWAKAEVLRRNYKFQESEVLLDKVIKLSPDYVPALISLSYIRYHDSKFVEALVLLKQVLRQDDLDRENKALAYMLLGNLNAKKASKGKFLSKFIYGTQIKCYFEKAKILAPDLSEVRLGLGTFYLLAPAIAGGDLVKAIEELEYAVRLTPDFATANARLAQGYKKKGDAEKYNFYLQRARDIDPDNEVLSQEQGAAGNIKLYKDTRAMLGTFVEVVSPDKEAAVIVFNEIRRIESLLSKYNPESEIIRLNKTGNLRASPDTFYVIKKAQEFYLASGGAFDITVGPLMDLWGFTDKQYSVPAEEKIQDTLKITGSDKIIFNEKDFMVQFKTSGMKIDLGAIAKGYAVDCAVKKIKEKGIKSCLVNAGGQIYCLGDKSGKPWRVAVRNPRGEKFLDYLELKNKAVATSGDYEQYFKEGSRRYAHILNPRTGYPAQSGVISVTVIAPDGLTSDALATSIFVLGKAAGQELAKKFPGVEVRIIEEKDVSHN